MISKVIGIFLLLNGILFGMFGAYLVWERNMPVDFTRINNAKTNIDSTDVNYPTIIKLPKLGLELPISPAKITNGKWDDPKHSVAFWQDSVLPGEAGNSVFYGHNWPNIFGRLKNSKIGDEIEIGFGDGTTKNFVVENTYIVTADQTHILNQTEDSRLTIYTCTGFLDSKRFVVIAVQK